MTVSVRVSERLLRVAPFGVQFRDPLSASFVREGLQVALYPVGQPWRRVLAHPNPSAVYVLHEGPGLGRATRGTGDDAYWLAPPESREYRCEVTDLQARFQPVSFRVRLPFRGLFAPDCAPHSPPSKVQGVSLFCAPTRPLSATLAVVRAELVDAITGAPAAWALVAAHYRGSELGSGVADRNGRLLLAFPYPEPERRPHPSPPDAAAAELEGSLMSWQIRLRAFYEPRLASEAIPDYCALLAQREARLLEERSPPLELDTTTLILGREFVYPSAEKPRLFVAPA